MQIYEKDIKTLNRMMLRGQYRFSENLEDS